MQKVIVIGLDGATLDLMEPWMDKGQLPNFEKIRQLDACQYPGFERVAGDEDALRELSKRFKNRYFCKYVWKPQKFKSLVCTGCGRCIEACIGKINKNELFRELA